MRILLYGNRLVSGSGDVKLTKDGNVLLHEMVILLKTCYEAHNFVLKNVCESDELVAGSNTSGLWGVQWSSMLFVVINVINAPSVWSKMKCLPKL